VGGGQIGCQRYEMVGIVERQAGTFQILEVPVHKPTDHYKAVLEEKDEKREILGFQARHTDIRIDFTVEVGENNDCPLANATADEIVQKFKLGHFIATSNMILFDAQGKIKHYKTVDEILEDHFVERSQLYVFGDFVVFCLKLIAPGIFFGKNI
jgi:DNA topoisomerase II